LANNNFYNFYNFRICCL